MFGISDHFATSKLARGRELLLKSDIPPHKTILVGDTDHDLDVGKELGIDVLLIADGHQSFEKLSGIHSNVIESRFV